MVFTAREQIRKMFIATTTVTRTVRKSTLIHFMEQQYKKLSELYNF